MKENGTIQDGPTVHHGNINKTSMIYQQKSNILSTRKIGVYKTLHERQCLYSAMGADVLKLLFNYLCPRPHFVPCMTSACCPSFDQEFVGARMVTNRKE